MQSPELLYPGEHDVASEVICTLTRFGLRSFGDLVATYRDARVVAAAANASKTPGLLLSRFLVEGPTSGISISLWNDQSAIAHFGTNVPEHVDAARRVFGRLRFDPARGPALWSTKWKLVAVSHNLDWDDFDLRSVLQGGARPHTAEAGS